MTAWINTSSRASAFRETECSGGPIVNHTTHNQHPSVLTAHFTKLRGVNTQGTWGRGHDGSDCIDDGRELRAATPSVLPMLEGTTEHKSNLG